MKSTKSIKNSYHVRNALANFFRVYKTLLIVLSIIVLLGLVTGIFTASKYSGTLEMENIPDSNFVSFISGDKGSFGLFFSYFVNFALLIGVIILLSSTPVLPFVACVCLFVLGYRLGFLVSALITLFSFAGIINVVVIILPFELCLLFIMIVITAISIYKYRIYKKYGCTNTGVNYKRLYLLLIILFVIVLFIKCMIMPIINITIIVN